MTKRMLMKNPPHPGLGIRDEIDELGLSVAAAAEGLGVTRQQLYASSTARAASRRKWPYGSKKAIGSTAEMWLRLQMNYDMAQIRQRAASIKVKRLVPA